MNKLLEQINREVEQKEPTDLGGLMLQITSRVNKIQKRNYLENGLVPVYDQGNNNISGYSNDVENAYNGKFPVVIFGDHTLKLRKIMSPFYLGADGNQLIEPIDDNLLDRNYFYYLLLARKPKSYGYERHFKYLKEISIKLPSFLTQKKIAGILSAYDAKIENNNKIIKNLETTAQTIFNEWFVNFRFPGYEKAKMVESEMGEIPEGWEIKDIEDVFTVILGGTPSREKPEYWGGNIPWINSGEVNKLRILEATEHITELGLSKSNARLIKAGATVLAITGATLGQVSRLEIDSTANQSVVGIFDEKNILNEYLYLYISNNILDLISGASGGAQQHINKQMVENYKIVIPSEKIIQEFNKTIVSSFLLIKELFKENVSLKSQRDQLLAKLI